MNGAGSGVSSRTSVPKNLASPPPVLAVWHTGIKLLQELSITSTITGIIIMVLQYRFVVHL